MSFARTLTTPRFLAVIVLFAPALFARDSFNKILTPAQQRFQEQFDTGLTPAERQLLDSWEKEVQELDALIRRRIQDYESSDKPFGGRYVLPTASIQYAKPTSPDLLGFNAVLLKAESGNAQAQAQLAGFYETGKGTVQSDSQAFKWWLKAAEQGVRTAQHNVGVAYTVGIGVARNNEQAVKWFTLAAQQGDKAAELYAHRLREGNGAAIQTVMEAAPASSPKPHTTTRYGEKEEVCAEVVKKFASSHKYIPGSFVCVDFAAGVRYELMERGINAKVRVGDMNREVGAIEQADHAWVMAEVTPGTWLAIEPQREIIYREKNASYYQGWDFDDNNSVLDHNRLVHDLYEAKKRYQDAIKERDEIAAQYNANDSIGNVILRRIWDVYQHNVQNRQQEVQEVWDRLVELKRKAKPSS
jgi:TPR repeat protein